MELRPAAIQWLFLMLNLVNIAYPSSTVSLTSGFEKQTLYQGQNFTLRCTASGLYHVTITWLLDGLPLQYEDVPVKESVRFKADNPHSLISPNLNDHNNEYPRYLIKNSNEVNENDDDEDQQNGGVADDDLKQAVSVVETRQNRASPDQPVALVPPTSESDLITVTSELTLRNASVEDGGIYACIARDVMKETVTWRNKITVLGKPSVRQTRPVFALFNSLIIIPCTVLGTDKDVTVKWFHAEFTSGNDDDRQWVTLPNDRRQTVHPNGSLEIREARKNNEGVYRCAVELNRENLNMTTTLKVMVPPKINPFPLRPVRVGKPAGAFCIVSEGDFPLDITWFKNGEELASTDAEIHTSGKRAISFAIDKVSLSSAGNYSCCAENNVSKKCVVEELIVQEPPRILDLPKRLDVISGNHVMLPCNVTGFPKPNVMWMKALDESRNSYIEIPIMNSTTKIGQFDNGTLYIRNVSSADVGKYSCQAVNIVGEISRYTSLQVNNPARILNLVGTDDVIYDNDVIMKCSLWGDDVMEVHWYKDGRLLYHSNSYRVRTNVMPNWFIGEKHSVSLSTLVVVNASRWDTGVFSCRANNQYGVATRNISILVRAPPSLPSKFEVIDKGSSFLRMLVVPGEDDGGSKLLEFIVSYVALPEEITEEDREKTAGHEVVTRLPSQSVEAKVIRFPASTSGSELGQEFVLDELECGVEYEVKIKTENSIGESFSELVLKANTIGSVPVIPAVSELVVDVNRTTAVLDLRAWQNGGCPITDLAIEYARHGDTKWNVTEVDKLNLVKILSSAYGEGKIPDYVIVRHLQVGTWYKIWTSACNNAGCNYVTHSVATLTEDGSTVPPLITDDIATKSTTNVQDVRFLVPMVCGFGLVLLLVAILLFYRFKQRSKKQMRLKEARKMADSLLYKTSKSPFSISSSSSKLFQGRKRSKSNRHIPVRELAEVERNLSVDDIHDDVQVTENIESSSAHDGEGLDSYQQTPVASSVTITADHENSTLAVEVDLNHCKLEQRTEDMLPSNDITIVCSSSSADDDERKKPLVDKAELAVFRGDAESDDEDAVSLPLVCDDSAFSDVGTWSYFHTNVNLNRKQYSPLPMRDVEKSGKEKQQTKQFRDRSSFSSSGTDEELALVFGLPSSKRRPFPSTNLAKRRDSDKENKQEPEKKEPFEKRPDNSDLRRNTHASNNRSNDIYNSVDGVRHPVVHSNHHRSPLVRPVPHVTKPTNHDDAVKYHQRQNLHINDLNKFCNARKHGSFNPYLISMNMHKPPSPRSIHGRTYSHENYPKSNSLFIHPPKASDQSGYKQPQYAVTPPVQAVPERKWVDSYDSRCGTSRSKQAMWDSTDLDGVAYTTPPADMAFMRLEQDHPQRLDSSGHSPDSSIIHVGDVNDNHIDLSAGGGSSRKLDSNSPRDSGIGTDDTPSVAYSSSAAPSSQENIMADHRHESNLSTKNREISPQELDKQRSGFRAGSRSKNSQDDDFVFPISPPPSPPVSGTRLAPHIFVDISGKCNTTPTRRCSKPPFPATARRLYNSSSTDRIPAPPRSAPEYYDACFLTPPSSGPTSPADAAPIPDPKQRRSCEMDTRDWSEATLDCVTKYRPSSNPLLLNTDHTPVGRYNDHSSYSCVNDTTYNINCDNTWQASTLV